MSKLPASERVTLIGEVARRLGQKEWAVIDLTLKQFDLPWNNEWPGSDLVAYVIEQIESAEDSQIIKLGRHLVSCHA